MTLRGKKNHAAVLLFLTVFGAFLTVATFYDLEISRILTHYSLKEGAYYTRDIFANFFEAVGMFPTPLLTAAASLSVGWFINKAFPYKVLKVLSLVVAGGYAVYALAGGLQDVILYPMKHMIAEDAERTITAIKAMKPTIYAISYFFSALSVGLTLCLTRNLTLDTWRRLAYFALIVFLVSLISGWVVSSLKSYVDRVRFRSMNSVYGQAVGGFDLYTRWYEVKKNAALLRATPLIDYTDAFRSFPSGHTKCAALSYSLIVLIDCFGIRKKGAKLALWLGPIVWTGLTAIGRIVAGAHFMSDVLIGGTVPFLLVILFREIILRRFRTVKEMYPFLGRKRNI